jgi:hypothetical protein
MSSSQALHGAAAERLLLRRRPSVDTEPHKGRGPRHSHAAQVQQQTAGALPSATTHARASTATSSSSDHLPAAFFTRRPPAATTLTPLLACCVSAPPDTCRGAAADSSSLDVVVASPRPRGPGADDVWGRRSGSLGTGHVLLPAGEPELLQPASTAWWLRSSS